MTLWPSKAWSQLLLPMFTACFDSSGHEKEHDYICVAGFVSNAQGWIDFTEAWKSRLGQDGLTYFRASECQNFQKAFKNWNGQTVRRKKLWDDLIDIIMAHAFRKVACGILIKPYSQRLSHKTKTAFRLNAFVVCARTCVAKINLWAQSEKINTPIEYVFEEGDEGGGMLMERFKDDALALPIFKPKKDRIEKGVRYSAFVPLQAADFLAYECFLATKHFAKNIEPPSYRPLHRFRTMLGGIWLYEAKSLADLEGNLDRRFKELNRKTEA
jgi:hypothetical protein